MSNFEKYTSTPETAERLITLSDMLATGEQWLKPEPSETDLVVCATKAEPLSEWSRIVNSIERDFAEDYDLEEYKNQALKMLNLEELALLAKTFQMQPVWEQTYPQGLSRARVTDVDCGTGRVALYEAAMGAELTAIDQTAAYVAITARKMSRLVLKGTVDLRVQSAESYVNEADRPSDYITAMFGVLNHCEDWEAVLAGLQPKVKAHGALVLSMYGSPEAVVFQELERDLDYEPAIMVRRTEGGLLLGANADEVLPARFPYPADVASEAKRAGMTIENLQPLLMVPSLFPSDPNPKNVQDFLGVVRKNYGTETAAYLAKFADSPKQLLIASLVADIRLQALGRQEDINKGAYFGMIATRSHVGGVCHGGKGTKLTKGVLL